MLVKKVERYIIGDQEYYTFRRAQQAIEEMVGESVARFGKNCNLSSEQQTQVFNFLIANRKLLAEQLIAYTELLELESQ